MPDELEDAFHRGRVVVFAGAGISTESRLVMPSTLLEQIAVDVGADPEKAAFPEVMGAYVDRHGRPALLQRIRDRLDYIRGFPELYEQATTFHREISSIHFLNDIVTTNWDTGFEEVCGALPLVVPEDYAFWETPGRKVLKIHGSISNWGTVVATAADYERCYRRLRTGVVGATLKHLLATKRVVFVGYSLADPDFQRIYRFLKREMGEILPRSYIVTLDDALTEDTHAGSMVIHTSGDYFARVLKERLVAKGCLIGDDVFDRVSMLLAKVRLEHARLSKRVVVRQHPEAVYAHSYQDGLIHAFERIRARYRAGEYSSPDHVVSLMRGYEPLRDRKLKRRRYWDVAYIDGYVNGLLTLLLDKADVKGLPMYYAFGAGDIQTYDDYVEAAAAAQELHKTAYRVAQKLVKPFTEDTTVLHHTPFLLG